MDLENNSATVVRRRAIDAPFLTGLLAGCLTTLLGLALAPRFATAISSVLARAAAYVLLVLAVVSATVFIVARLHGIRSDSSNRRQEWVHCVITCLWLPPLLLLATDKSSLALIVWILIAAELCRWIASRPETEDRIVPQGMFALLRRDFIPVLGGVIVGSLSLEAAAIASLGPHSVLAVFFFVAGTVLVVLRAVRMLRESPPSHPTRTPRQILSVLAISILLTAFAWLPHTTGQSGGGFSGDSVASLEDFLRSFLARHAGGGGTVAARKHNTANASESVLADEVFPGIILYPETDSPKKLVAPKLTAVLGKSGTGTSDPLVIPFYGVYWFWRPPAVRPPSTSVLRRGSPAAHTFRSNDGSPLWMEARQNLAVAIDLSHCGAIEVVIENADSIPRSVAMELQVRDTAVPGQPSESLGMQEVAITAGEKHSKPLAQTLRFRVPSQTAIARFDELTVRFRLQWWRGSRSANIAINRFRLVPRG